MQKWALFLIVFLLGAGAGASGMYLWQDFEAKAEARNAALPANEALAALRESMVDPESTQVRNVFRRGQALCGEVNSRNRMGGYVGYRRFVVLPGEIEVETDRSDYRTGRLIELWVRHCDESAYSFSTEEAP